MNKLIMFSLVLIGMGNWTILLLYYKRVLGLQGQILHLEFKMDAAERALSKYGINFLFGQNT